MPQLTRLRFVSVGHSEARADDLTLDFTREGQPVDSTLWLRNGGGKSSLLAMFFTLLVPKARAFIGAKAEGGARELGEYVRMGDTSVVIAEWLLDGPPGELSLAARSTYLTGTVLEWTEGRGDAGRELDRAYFGLRTVAGVAETTLDGLPLRATPSGPIQSMKSLRQAITTLRTTAYEAEAVWTTNQKEWGELLESVGLDPRLFEAQTLMNAGEGDADRIFTQFRDSDDYVKFFLQLLAPREMSDPIVKNLAAHRDALRRRQTELLPERVLVTGLVERLQPMAEVQAERAARSATVAGALGRAEATDRQLATTCAAQEAVRAEAERERLAQLEIVREAQAQVQNARLEATFMALWSATQAVEQAEHQKQQIEAQDREAERAKVLLNAALTLRNVRRCTARAERLTTQLAEREAEHLPLLEVVEGSARRYAEAIESRRSGADSNHREAGAAIAAADQAFAAARQEETAAIRAEQEARAAQAEARKRRQEAESEWRKFVEAGDAGSDQGVEGAMAHQQRLLEDADTERRRTEQRRAEATDRRARLRQEQRDAERRATEAHTVAAQAAAALRRADDEAAKLGRDPVLAQALELDDSMVNVAMLGPDAAHRLRSLGAAAHANVLAAHVERTTDQRALDHLETHGVLPPSPIVERLLRRLRERLPRAWDGWRYLAETHALDAARAIVARAPAIATGIVVWDQDLEVAREALHAFVRDLDEPVLLVPASSVAVDGPPAPGEVFGPGDNAHLDQAAGAAARVRHADRVRKHTRRQEENEALSRAAERAAAALEGWQQQYTPAWRAATAATLESASATELQARDRVTEAEQELGTLDIELQQLEQARDAARQREAKTRLALERLRGWAGRHPGGVPAYRAQEADAHARERGAAADVTAAKARQAEAEQRRKAAQDRRTEAEVERSAMIAQLERVRYLRERPSAGVPGDLVALEREHAEAIRYYEQTVQADTLRTQIEDARTEARGHQETLRQQCRNLPEAEVASTLDALPAPDMVEAKLEDATQHGASVRGRLGNVHQVLARAAEQHKRAEEAWRAAGGLELTSLVAPANEAEAVQRGKLAREREQKAAREAADAEDYAALAEQERDRAKHALEAARDAAARLQVIRSGLGRLATTLGVTGTLTTLAPLTADDVRGMLQRLESLLDQEQAATAALDSKRGVIHGRVLDWCNDAQFGTLTASVGPRIRRYTADQLEGQAAELLDALALRLKTIEDDLAASDRDRDLLVQQALGAARDGAALLQRLARSSVIPDTVPALGSKALLKAELHVPELEREGQQRLGALLDQYVTADALPGPDRFLQEAVLRLAGPITLKILRPSLETSARYEPITTLAKFSGGEKLTVSTLLYCALATTRAKTVGRRQEPTGVLVQDNPFGKASRASFIELQRAVAHQLGVQLVYFTGIEDFEALSRFPNLVRLKNARYDRRTGERVIELGDAVETEALLSAVRIARKEGSATLARDVA